MTQRVDLKHQANVEFLPFAQLYKPVEVKYIPLDEVSFIRRSAAPSPLPHGTRRQTRRSRA
jgi:hypothetical protein